MGVTGADVEAVLAKTAPPTIFFCSSLTSRADHDSCQERFPKPARNQQCDVRDDAFSRPRPDRTR